MAALTDLTLTDGFIESLIERSQLPAVQSQLTHQQLLDRAYAKILRKMAPLLITARKSFFREIEDITLVASQSEYDIPEKAMLEKLYLTSLLGPNGEVSELQYTEPTEDLFFFQTEDGHPIRFRLDDKVIVVNPPPTAADLASWPTLRTYIHRRPGRLVRATSDEESNEGRAAQVLSVDTITGIVTYTDTLPANFTDLTTHDVYSLTGLHKRKVTEITATAATTTTQTFAAADVADIVAGDWVCLEGETVFLPVPAEMVEHVQDLVIADIAATQGDKDAIQNAEKAMRDDIALLFPASAKPSEGNSQRVTLLGSPFLKNAGLV